MLSVIKDISDEQATKMLNYIEGDHLTTKGRCRCLRNKLIVLLMLDAGLRVGEVIRLRRGSLIFANHFLESVVVTADIAKNNRERTVPMTVRIRIAVQQLSEMVWVPNDIGGIDYAFYGASRREPLTTRQVERIVSTAALAAFGVRIHPHQLRHTFATRMMRICPMRVVQELLGHKNLTSTQIYTHPNGKDLKKAIADLDEQTLKAL